MSDLFQHVRSSQGIEEYQLKSNDLKVLMLQNSFLKPQHLAEPSSKASSLVCEALTLYSEASRLSLQPGPAECA